MLFVPTILWVTAPHFRAQETNETISLVHSQPSPLTTQKKDIRTKKRSNLSSVDESATDHISDIDRVFGRCLFRKTLSPVNLETPVTSLRKHKLSLGVVVPAPLSSPSQPFNYNRTPLLYDQSSQSTLARLSSTTPVKFFASALGARELYRYSHTTLQRLALAARTTRAIASPFVSQ